MFLTPAGEAELARLRELVRAADDALTEGLSEDEIAQLRGLLAKIHL